MTVASPAEPLPFESLRFFSSLFRHYCCSFERVAQFYKHDYRSSAGRVAAADAAAAHGRDREGLSVILREQNQRWGADAAVLANVDRLREASTVAVVTGQQLGLFSGPLYTVLKTLTVVRLAEQLEDETGRPVVPVFWLEGEDHDFAEVAWSAVYAGNDVVRLTYGSYLGTDGLNVGPMGRLKLMEEITEVTDKLAGLLPATDFKDAILEMVRDAYQPGTTFLDAFARLMTRFFAGTGLVLISPDDSRLKNLARPLFLKEVRETRDVAERIENVSEQLRNGYHAQIAVRSSNLFLLDENGRHALDEEDGEFLVRGTDRRFRAGELSDAVADHPERFSGNVVLRPLVQDTLLPTALYVAGPSEIAYFAQLRPAYEWAGIPMPVIYPRASATIVERKVQKVLDEYEMPVSELDHPLEELFQRLLRERINADVDSEFDEAGRLIRQAIDHVRPVLQRLDPTLVKTGEATRAAMLKEFDRFRHRVLKSEKRAHEQVRDKLGKAQINLFPFGKPQERVISILYFLNKYGPSFLSELGQALSMDTSRHQLIRV